MSSRSLVLGVLALSLVACGASAPSKPPADGVYDASRPGGAIAIATGAPASSEADLAIPIGPEDPTRGPRSAPVTLVVFSDFQCPFCGRLESTLSRLRGDYGDKLRVVFKHKPLPFHQHARLAADVGAAVMALRGPDAFWSYHDALFTDQRGVGPEIIQRAAEAAGASYDVIGKGLEDGRWGKVDADLALADKLGVSGTPGTFVNGILVSGAQPYEAFKEVIDSELDEAAELAKDGVRPTEIYSHRLAVTSAVLAATRAAAIAREEARAEPPVDTTVYQVPIGSSPVRGSASALVTIVEFADYQCPFCKRVQPALAEVAAKYGDKVRFVFKHEPLGFHPRALPAARLALEARAQKGDAGFWKVHEALFAKQPALADEDLEQIAKDAGLNVTRAMASVRKEGAYAKELGADEDLASDVRASGTPHFFINGRRLSGAQPAATFEAMIDEQLVKAEALVASGVAPKDVYAAVMKTAQPPTEPERVTVAASPGAPFRGTKGARVVIQQFSDYECPFCQRVEPTLTELLKAYPGKIQIVWRNNPLPFHPHARLAAEASHEAFVQKGNAGFEKMHALLTEHAEGLEREALEGYAKKIGLDMTRFNKALDDSAHEAVIKADQDAAREAGLGGTPSFAIGPYELTGAQPLAKFKRLVERVLAGPAKIAAP